MDWRDQRQSDNVENKGGVGGRGVAFGCGGLGVLVLVSVIYLCGGGNLSQLSNELPSQTNIPKNETINQNSNSVLTVSETSTSTAPAVDNLETPESQAHITKGEQIYKRTANRTGLPVMFGWQASKISILIPTSDWNKMTKDDQINLTYYAENLVREIRIDPVSYVRRWSIYYKQTEHLERGGEYDGLNESFYIKQVENLCNSCWDITTGQAKHDGFYDENIPVTGTSVREFRQPIERK